MTDDFKLVTGNIVPTITYFDKKGFIQEKVNRLQVSHALNHGADAIFILGSTGEGTFFKDLGEKMNDERSKLILVSVDAILEFKDKTNKKISTIIGAYGENSDEVLTDMETLCNNTLKYFSKHKSEYQYLYKYMRGKEENSLMKNIISGFVVPPPRNKKLSLEQLKNYYIETLKKTIFPIYLYNNPASFGGNEISSEILPALTEFQMCKGIKDSSDKIEQKVKYLKYLSKDFSVSCGKEGMIGTFIKEIDLSLRMYAGIVPSLGNLTNNPSKVYQLGLENKDKEMIEEQENMNLFRGDLYDSKQSKGKAQRGVKQCIKLIYNNIISDISTNVRKEFQRELDDVTIDKMKSIIKFCLEKGYIIPIN